VEATESDPRSASFGLVLACFFFSGFSALLYQTAWTREFSFVFGTSDLAVAAVLAAYMGGLAAGSAIASRVAHRLTRPILAYGILELGIALFALAVPGGMRLITAVYVAVLGGGETASEPGGIASFFRLGTAFILLLPPTALMGATLPLLARHAVRRDEEVGPRIGSLYAMNTAGAIAGTVCAAFLLLPAIGLRQTVYAGAAVNALVFAGAALLARRAAAPPPAEPDRRGDALRGRWILPLMAFSGAASFVYEVMWTRLLSQILGGSVYAFATMLASFLLGIALGSAVAGRIARTARRATTGFAWSQIGIAVLSIAAFRTADSLPAMARALGAGATAGDLANAGISAAVLLPFALCIGATFPFAVRVVVERPERSASATARVYAWNTVGSIVGAIAAGFLLLPRFGFQGTLVIGCATNLGLAAVAALAARPRRKAPLAAAAAVGALLALHPIAAPWQLLRSSPFRPLPIDGPIEFFAVGRSSTVMLADRGEDWQLYTNGLPESLIARPGRLPGRSPEARWLGFLPVLLRPEAERALLIGLGGGIALEGMPSVLDPVDVVELEPEVVAANQHIGALRDADPLGSPRVRLVVNDARGALMLSSTRYDAIVSQPSHPWTAGASHLYTKEFFELAKERLTEDGVFVQWIGIRFVDEALLQTLLATLGQVFAHVQVYRPVPPALLFAASDAPFDLPSGTAAALRVAGEDLARYGVELPEDAAAALVLDDSGARAFAGAAPINTDDRNLLATRSARLDAQAALDAPEADRLLAPFDPLPALVQSLDPLRLVRRLASARHFERATKLAQGLNALDREIALGWIAAGKNLRRAAARHFELALTRDPSSGEAQAGRFLMRIHPVGDDAPARIRLFQRARTHFEAREFEALADLDAALAEPGPDDPLFPMACQLRAEWRLADGGTTRAIEALSIIDRVIVRGTRIHDYMIRARAGIAAGRPEATRAALGYVSRRLAPAGRNIAREAIALVDALPPDLRDDAQRAHFERIAR
jgi:spermidine synthase